METKAISKKDKNFHIINYTLMIAFALTCIGLAIYYAVIGDPNNRLLASFGVTLLFILPILIELIFRCRISNLVTLCFITYTVLAGLLGCVFNFYNISFLKLNEWYDIFIHTLAGYVFSFIGLIFISKFENYKKLSPWTVLIFCVFFTLAIELIWELMEWFADSCLGQQSQGHPPVGQPAPLVTDTNIDMLCNFIGSILFLIHFVIGKFSKVKLGMNYIEEELCGDKIIVRKQKKNKQEETKEIVENIQTENTENINEKNTENQQDDLHNEDNNALE